MKKIIQNLFLLAALLCLLPMSAAAENEKVTVNPENVIKATMPFGYGRDWHTAYPYFTGNGESMEPSKEFVLGMKQADMQIPLLRAGGGSSNSFYWKTKLGPLEERSGVGFAKNEGYVEWIRAGQAISPDVQFLIVLNLNDTTENNQDLVRFLTLEPDNPNAVGADGTNWAQLRVDLGVEEPVQVFAFELGNELYPTGTYTNESLQADADEYTARCTALIPALRAVNPEIRIAPLMFSMAMISYYDNNGSETYETASRIWNETVISATKDDIDYVVHHDYFNLVTSAERLGKRDIYFDVIDDYIAGTDIKIILTETGYYFSGTKPPASLLGSDLPNTNVLGAAIGLGRFYRKVYSMPNVAAVVHYGFTGDENNGSDGESEWWMACRYCQDGVWRVSATGAIGNLYAKACAGKPIETTVETGTNGIQAQAFLMEDGKIQLIILPEYGRESAEMTVDVMLEGYQPVTKTVVSGKNNLADNNTVTPNGVKTQIYDISNKMDSTYTLGPYAVVSLLFAPEGEKITPDSLGEMKIRQNGTQIEITDTLYADHDFAAGTQMSLLILPADVSYITAEKSDITAVGTAQLLDDICYFCTSMPAGAKSGQYQAVVGCGDTYHIQEFWYSAEIFKTLTAACIDGQVQATVAFAPDAPQGEYTVTAMYGTNAGPEAAKLYQAAYVGTVTKTADTAEIAFSMPTGVLSGAYTLTVGGCGTQISAGFLLERPEETLRISCIPVNTDGETVTGAEDCQEILVSVQNLTDAPISVSGMLGYYQNGRLTGAAKSQEITVAGGKATELSIAGNLYEAELVKLYLWDTETMTPHTAAYYFK